MQTTRRLCLCSERCAARDDGRFGYSAIRQGWVFTNGPRRRMSPSARYHALSERSEFPHVDHTGERYSHECCPWCGGDLPMTAPHWNSTIDTGEGAE